MIYLVAILVRFWAQVHKTPGCWTWTGGCNADGYGRMRIGTGQRIRAHRISWFIHHGPVPVGMCVLHRCDNPPCINPDHLFLGTNPDNTADRHSKGRSACGDRSGARLHPDTHVRGERSPLAKLAERQVVSIRELWAHGAERRELSENFNVTPCHIDKIVSRRAWRHL